MTNTVKLSTGREVYAHSLVFGLGLADPEPENPQLCYGYDGCVATCLDKYQCAEDPLTAAECVEIADMMLEAWANYRSKAALLIDAAVRRGAAERICDAAETLLDDMSDGDRISWLNRLHEGYCRGCGSSAGWSCHCQNDE